MGSKNGLSLDRVYQASFALKDVARKTDLIYSPHFNNGNEVYLKTENLQVTGSFKLRGAYYKISQLTAEQKKAIKKMTTVPDSIVKILFSLGTEDKRALSNVVLPLDVAPATTKETP